jgi:hypothetical protein
MHSVLDWTMAKELYPPWHLYCGYHGIFSVHTTDNFSIFSEILNMAFVFQKL